MAIELVVPFVLGVAAVLQVTLNKAIAAHTGFGAAVALNSLVAAVCAAGFALACALRAQPDGLLRWNPDLAAFRPWWIVPGIVGFLLVLGLPWAVQRVGALSTFVALVTAQMLASAAWDWLVGGIPLSASRVAGACCAVAGALLLGRSSP
ncbi:MAG: DMT family transporter [Planctomycetota bacterium]